MPARGPAVLSVDCAGEELLLHAARAVSWPARRTLVVADPHFGKDETFRRAGIAIPAGVLPGDLARLGRLIAETGARRLVILGDFFHASPADGADFLAEFTTWRRSLPALGIDVIAGNHDSAAGAAALAGLVAWHDQPLADGPFLLAHEPVDPEAGYALCGHLHPVVRLASATDRLRPPAFWFRRRHAVLPAFGGFTGGAAIRRGARDRVFVAAGELVRELPPNNGRGRIPAT